MKKYILLLCILNVLPVLPQANGPADSIVSPQEIISTNINDTENKQKLLQGLDQIKRRLDEADHIIACLDQSKQNLQQSRRELANIRPLIIQRSLRNIWTAYAKKDNDLTLLEEERLRNRLLQFIHFYQQNDTSHFLYAGINTRQHAYAPFDEMLNYIMISPPLDRFLTSSQDSLFINSKPQFDSLAGVLGTENITELCHRFEDAVNQEESNIMAYRLRMQYEINELTYTEGNINEKLDRETDIDYFSILLGLPLFCFTVLVLFTGPGFIQARYGNGIPNLLLEKSQNILLDLSTVLLLTMSVLILGLSGNVNSDVLGTLIGGISGYVLNKAKT